MQNSRPLSSVWTFTRRDSMGEAFFSAELGLGGRPASVLSLVQHWAWGLEVRKRIRLIEVMFFWRFDKSTTESALLLTLTLTVRCFSLCIGQLQCQPGAIFTAIQCSVTV